MSSPPRMRSAPSASVHKSKEVHLRASDPKLEEISTDVSAKKKKNKKQASPFYLPPRTLFFVGIILLGQ